MLTEDQIEAMARANWPGIEWDDESLAESAHLREAFRAGVRAVIAAHEAKAAPAVPMSESQRADMICAVAAICTGTSSRTVAATAIEWVERHYGITTHAAPSQEPVNRPQNCGTSYCSCIECVCEPELVTLTDEWPFMTPHEVELRLGRQEVVLRFVTESETQQACDAIIAALREKQAKVTP